MIPFVIISVKKAISHLNTGSLFCSQDSSPAQTKSNAGHLSIFITLWLCGHDDNCQVQSISQSPHTEISAMSVNSNNNRQENMEL